MGGEEGGRRGARADQGGEASVALRLGDPALLRVALEGAPDADGEDLVRRLDGLARDLSSAPGQRVSRVRLLVDERCPGGAGSGDLAPAWQELCEARAAAHRRQARAVRRDGWVALRYGALCFAGALALSVGFEQLEPLPRWANRPLSEGFLIASWVSLWRPMELLLYEWLPFGRMARAFEAVGRAEIVTEALPFPRRRGEPPPSGAGRPT